MVCVTWLSSRLKSQSPLMTSPDIRCRPRLGGGDDAGGAIFAEPEVEGRINKM